MLPLLLNTESAIRNCSFYMTMVNCIHANELGNVRCFGTEVPKHLTFPYTSIRDIIGERLHAMRAQGNRMNIASVVATKRFT